MKSKFIYISSFLLLSLSSCQYFSKNEIGTVDMGKHPIVTVNSNTLYLYDIERLLPSYLAGEDSINAANEYIRVWVNEQLLYDKARQNVTNSQMIEQLVEDYRKSLITNSYRERILKEHFAKSTSESKLKSYYDSNKEIFKLDEPIIKGLYLKIPVSSSALSDFKKWYKQTTETAISNIENKALQNAVNYEYFYNKWISFPEIVHNIPQVISDEDDFLKKNKFIEVSDSSYVYLLNIKEYKLAGEEAPYEYLKDKLPEIYKEKNRAKYIEQIQKDLYDKALGKKKVKFYEK